MVKYPHSAHVVAYFNEASTPVLLDILDNQGQAALFEYLEPYSTLPHEPGVTDLVQSLNLEDNHAYVSLRLGNMAIQLYRCDTYPAATLYVLHPCAEPNPNPAPKPHAPHRTSNENLLMLDDWERDWERDYDNLYRYYRY